MYYEKMFKAKSQKNESGESLIDQIIDDLFSKPNNKQIILKVVEDFLKVLSHQKLSPEDANYMLKEMKNSNTNSNKDNS